MKNEPAEAAGTVTPDREERALARAVLYRYLAACYRHPEANEEKDLLELEEGVIVASQALSEGEKGDLALVIEDLAGARNGQPRSRMSEDYGSLFSHAVQGACPPYESEYGDGDAILLQAHELGDLAAFYRAFGLAISARSHERLDHVSVELEYMGFLCQKEAHAEENHDPELAEITRRAGREFLKCHVARWLPAFARRLLSLATSVFYRCLARATLEFVAAECRRHELEPGPDFLRLRPPVEDRDSCFTCAMSSGSGPAPFGPEAPGVE